MKQVHMVSLGCPKNRVDSELMVGQMMGDGYSLTNAPEEADVLIVNTCAFIESAKQESINTILEMAEYKAQAEGRKLIVTGCMAQRYAKELAVELPEVDTFLGTNEFGRITDAITGTLPERAYISQGSYLYKTGDARTNYVRGGTAYVKVSEGCNRTCTFCIIPKIRGKQVSRSVADVVDEAHRLGESGVKELVLVAQDMTSYGVDFKDKRALVKLLRDLNEVPNIEWVRPLYMYPWNFTDELLETIQSCDKVLPYIDMPLQHVSQRLLKLMRRNIKREAQMKLIERLRAVPNSIIRTTFITGFPGETEEDFQELLEWVKHVEFDRVGVFPYSPEENTDAYDLPNQVPTEVAEERRDQIMEVQQEISRRKNESFVGKRLKVIVDGISDEHEYVFEGRHYGQAPDIDGVTYLSFEDGGDNPTPGDFVEVEIESATEYDLMGVVVPDAPLLLNGSSLVLNTSRTHG